MTESDPNAPEGTFERDVTVDKPGIVGARWWQRSLVSEDRTEQRRSVLKGLAVAGGILGAISLVGVGISSLVSDDREKVSLSRRSSLKMQKEFGWDFGARGRDLVFDGKSETPFVRADLEKLPEAMAPQVFAKYQVPTLLESLLAQPAATLPPPPDGSPPLDSSAPFRRLADVVVPVVTPAMETAYRAGEAFSRLCAEVPHVALLADLRGPEAVAFAAGACDLFEPVLLFDNWPHPQGVVPAHMALAALAYYQPRFAEQARTRTGSRPVFVLDRSRLAAYSEESDLFDNRYFARMPKLQALGRDGIDLVFYVVASPKELPEPDDLNGSLSPDPAAPASPASPSVNARAVALTEFGNADATGVPSKVFYGGSPETDGAFWVNYPLWPAFQRKSWQRMVSSTTKDYRFALRASPGSSLAGGGTAGTGGGMGTLGNVGTVGTVAVMVTASGLLVGAALDRRGSMNRFSGGWGG